MSRPDPPPGTVIPDEIIQMAITIESNLGLQDVSLIGLATTAWLRGWRDGHQAGQDAIAETNRRLRKPLSTPPHQISIDK